MLGKSCSFGCQSLASWYIPLRRKTPKREKQKPAGFLNCIQCRQLHPKPSSILRPVEIKPARINCSFVKTSQICVKDSKTWKHKMRKIMNVHIWLLCILFQDLLTECIGGQIYMSTCVSMGRWMIENICMYLLWMHEYVCIYDCLSIRPYCVSYTICMHVLAWAVVIAVAPGWSAKKFLSSRRSTEIPHRRSQVWFLDCSRLHWHNTRKR